MPDVYCQAVHSASDGFVAADLRPQLERLDRLICRSEGIDPGALSFAFRPLWQLDGPSKAALALSKAQTTQIYAGLKLWPAEVTARLVEAQLIADGTYPNAAAVFAERGMAGDQVTADAFPVRPGFDPAQPRDPDGLWTAAGQEPSAISASTKFEALFRGQLGEPIGTLIADDCSEEWRRAYEMCAD